MREILLLGFSFHSATPLQPNFIGAYPSHSRVKFNYILFSTAETFAVALLLWGGRLWKLNGRFHWFL